MAIDRTTAPEPPDDRPGPTEALHPAVARDLHRRAAAAPVAAVAASSPAPRDRPRHRGRRIAAAIAVLVVVLLGGARLGMVVDGARAGDDDRVDAAAEEGGDDPSGAEIDIEVEGEPPPPGFSLGEEAGDDLLDAIEIAGGWSANGGAGAPNGGTHSLPPLPPHPQPDPGPDPSEPDGGEVGESTDEPGGDPTPDPSTADPCAGLRPGAHLVTTPDPERLAPGVMSSSLTIRNCGSEPVDWTAATKPSVSLDDAAGTLAGGSEHQLGFAIDAAGFADASITFSIKISEPGFNQYVDIEATKAGLLDPGSVGPDPQGTITTGGPTGCAAACIVRAWLSPNASTPNPGLDVETSTPASISVFVSTSAPVPGPDGQPTFPEGGLIAATNDLQVVWSSVLSPLVAATDYHVVVRATDADGGIDNRVGTFRTTEPAVDPGLGLESGGAGAGCIVQCITKAWLTPDPASFDMDLEVASHTVARFEAFVSTEAPVVDDDGVPSFPGATPTATSDAYEMAWTTRLGPLEPETNYHVIVKATDGMFESSYRTGSFATRAGADQLLVSFHEVQVHHDGDPGGNPGELTFSFMANGQHVATTGEHRVDSGATVHLSDGDRWPGLSTAVAFDPSPSAWLPQLSAAAFERDADGLVESCAMGDRQADQGWNDGCDVKWDVVSSGLLQSSGIDSLPSCIDLGIEAIEVADHRCLVLESVGNGDDYPRFSVIVSIQPIDT